MSVRDVAITYTMSLDDMVCIDDMKTQMPPYLNTDISERIPR